MLRMPSLFTPAPRPLTPGHSKPPPASLPRTLSPGPLTLGQLAQAPLPPQVGNEQEADGRQHRHRAQQHPVEVGRQRLAAAIGVIGEEHNCRRVKGGKEGFLNCSR